MVKTLEVDGGQDVVSGSRTILEKADCFVVAALNRSTGAFGLKQERPDLLFFDVMMMDPAP